MQVSSRRLAGGSKDARVESSALTNVRASASGASSFARLFAEKLCFSGTPKIDLRLRRFLVGEETAAQPRGFGMQSRRSTASPQIERQSRNAPLFGASAFVRTVDWLIPSRGGLSLSDYHSLLAMDDMEKAKAKSREEDALRKCLPKEGELPNWADDWLANVWQGGNSRVSSKDSRQTKWIDPGDPKVMWKWDKRGWLSKTLDGGANWHRLHHTYDCQWKYVSDLAIAREDDKTILLAGIMASPFASDRGIMRSDDGGDHWYQVCEAFAAISVAFDPDNPQNAIAEIIAPSVDVRVSRVVFSTDGGKHWMTATRNGVALETHSESKMRELAARIRENRSA